MSKQQVNKNCRVSQERYGVNNMATVDRRIVRTQEAIKKAFLELMSEKVSIVLPFRIFLTGQILTVQLFIFITWINLICWIRSWKNISIT